MALALDTSAEAELKSPDTQAAQPRANEVAAGFRIGAHVMQIAIQVRKALSLKRGPRPSTAAQNAALLEVYERIKADPSASLWLEAANTGWDGISPLSSSAANPTTQALE